jgi:hypothetical protein
MLLMSKATNMKTLVVVGCSLAVLILFGISMVADAGDPPPVPALGATGFLPSAALSQPDQPPSPSPGVYSAAPYSMVVVGAVFAARVHPLKNQQQRIVVGRVMQLL